MINILNNFKKKMNVFIIPMLDDNFCYYVYKGDDIQKGLLVDVSEPEKVSAFMKTSAIETLTHILTTHKHHDHSGGNKELKS